MTVRSYHVTYAFQSESKLYNCLNVKEFLAQNRREIWSLTDCNGTRTHNHLVHEKLGEVQISLHKIVHVDWLRFFALHNKTDDERKGNAGGNGTAVEASWRTAKTYMQMTEEGRQLAKHLKALDSLATEDAVQTV